VACWSRSATLGRDPCHQARESHFIPNGIRIVPSVFPSFGARSWISKIRCLVWLLPLGLQQHALLLPFEEPAVDNPVAVGLVDR
jgi:hypothetical protein